jgi:hypothetical protein
VFNHLVTLEEGIKADRPFIRLCECQHAVKVLFGFAVGIVSGGEGCGAHVMVDGCQTVACLFVVMSKLAAHLIQRATVGLHNGRGHALVQVAAARAACAGIGYIANAVMAKVVGVGLAFTDDAPPP